VDDSETQLSKVLVGAAVGAGFAFLFLTSRGHRMLRDAGPWLDALIRDLQRLQSAAGKAKEALDVGRRSFAAVSDAIPFVHTRDKSWSSEQHH
jgi:hypothetical protein